MSLPLPSTCPLSPAPLEVQHVRTLYALDDAAWAWRVHATWRALLGVVKPEHLQPGSIPLVFHMLPIVKAHAQWASSPRARQAANYMFADLLSPYMSDEE